MIIYLFERREIIISNDIIMEKEYGSYLREEMMSSIWFMRVILN